MKLCLCPCLGGKVAPRRTKGGRLIWANPKGKSVFSVRASIFDCFVLHFGIERQRGERCECRHQISSIWGALLDNTQHSIIFSCHLRPTIANRSQAHLLSRFHDVSFDVISDYYKVDRCPARYSPRATTTNQPTNRAPNEPTRKHILGQKWLFLGQSS